MSKITKQASYRRSQMIIESKITGLIATLELLAPTLDLPARSWILGRIRHNKKFCKKIGDFFNGNRGVKTFVTQILLPFDLRAFQDSEKQKRKKPLIHRIAESTGKPVSRKILNMPIERLELSVRTLNCLKTERTRPGLPHPELHFVPALNTIGKCLELSEHNLLVRGGFGLRSFREFKKAIRKLGVQLPD